MTLDQTRACRAYEHVQEAQRHGEAFAGEYGRMALKLSALIRTAGLCQALHFVESRKKPSLTLLLAHLAAQLVRVDPAIDGAERLCKQAREASLHVYMQLTREALATITWYGRLARSVLNVDPTQEALADE